MPSNTNLAALVTSLLLATVKVLMVRFRLYNLLFQYKVFTVFDKVTHKWMCVVSDLTGNRGEYHKYDHW